MKKENIIRIDFEVPEKLYNDFMITIKGHYANRSEAIRDAMRLLIKKLNRVNKT